MSAEASSMQRERTSRGAVVVISGPSGVGKSTVCQRLCEQVPAEFSVSFTTRPIRPGESPDREYRFVPPAEFEKLLASGAMLEWAEVYGHKYGTPLAPVEQAIRQGRTIVLEIDINGTRQVRSRFPDAMAYFLLPPSPEEQRRRIVDRRTDAEAEIARRLSRADGEVRYASESGCYDRFIVNDVLDETVSSILSDVRRRTRA